MSEDEFPLQYFAIAIAGLGVVETLMGFWFARTSGPKKGVGYLMQTAGIGALFASLIFYWDWDYQQSFLVGLAIFAAGCVLGSLRLVRFMKTPEGQTQ